MDPVDLSHDPSPVVHAPSKLKDPRRPDSVPNQYCFSCPARSTTSNTVYSSLPWLPCVTGNDCWMDSCAPSGISCLVLAQHSKCFLYCMVRMSPFLHNPSILNPQLTTLVALLVIEQWRLHCTHLHDLGYQAILQTDKSPDPLGWGDEPHEEVFFFVELKI